MKILFVIPANKTDSGLKISTFIDTEIKSIKELVSDTEVFHFIDRRSIKGFRNALKSLKSLIQRYQPDIIHVHYGSTTAFLVAKSAGNIPWVITFGGSDLLGHPNKGIYWRIRESLAIGLSKYAARFATRIICVSENLSLAIPTSLKKRVSIIPRGVNTNFFIPLNKDDERKNLGWDLNKTYILFSMPRLNAEVKNKPLAMEVAGLLDDKMNNEVVLFPLTGRSGEFVRSAMNAADLLLVTSLHEGSPNIVKESMACNLPVISVDCGDVSVRLKGTQNCFVSNKYDAQELSELCSEVLLAAERSNGRNSLVLDGISIEIISGRLVGLYQEVIRGNGK